MMPPTDRRPERSTEYPDDDEFDGAGEPPLSPDEALLLASVYAVRQHQRAHGPVRQVDPVIRTRPPAVSEGRIHELSPQTAESQEKEA
jgi:hypothetical protein